MNYYEQIKAEVIKCCPEIMEWKEGLVFCVKGVINPGIYTVVAKEMRAGIRGEKVWICRKKGASGFAVVSQSSDYEILGSPIELHHILRTIAKIQNLNGLILVSENGRFHKKTATGHESLGDYNLALPLASQSEETLKGLSELLSGNK